MPAVAAFAVTAFTAVATAATATLTAIGATAGIATAFGSIGSQLLITAGLSALSNASKPKVNMGSQFEVKSGAVSPTIMLAGRTITAGVRMTDSMAAGKNNDVISYVTTLAHVGETGKVDAVKWGDDTLTFDASGNCTAPSKYIGAVVLYQSSGSWTQSALQVSTSNGFILPQDESSDWTTNHRALGCLTARLVFRSWKDCWKNNWHDPQFICSANTFELYDPRTQALCTTWTQRQNLAVWAYSWGKKWTSPTGVTIAGIGWTDSQIDLARLSYWANVCDTNGWKISAVIDCDPANKWETMKAICQAGAAEPTFINGKFSVNYSAARTSVVTLTEDDFITKPVQKSNVPYAYRPNRIIPRYISEASNWSVVDGSVVTSSTYISDDGGEYKTETMEFPFAGGGNTHVGQLAAYALANAREPFQDNVALKPQALYKLAVGDCITINAPTYGYSNYKCLVVNRIINPDFSSQIDCVTETDAKHTWALGQSTTPPDFTAQFRLSGAYCPSPSSGTWTVAAAQLSQGGNSIPVIKITGAIDYDSASAIVVRYRLNSIGSPWLGMTEAPPTATALELDALTPNTSYIIGISYRNLYGVEGAILEYTPTTSGIFQAGDVYYTAPNIMRDAQLSVDLRNRAIIIDNQPALPTMTRSIDANIGNFTSLETPAAAALTGGSFYGILHAKDYGNGEFCPAGRVGVRFGYSMLTFSGVITDNIDYAFCRVMGFNASTGVWDFSEDRALNIATGLQEKVFYFDLPAAKKIMLAVWIRVKAGVSIKNHLNTFKPALFVMPSNSTIVPPYVASIDSDRGADITGSNVAAAITGQGALATANSVNTSTIAADAVSNNYIETCGLVHTANGNSNTWETAFTKTITTNGGFVSIDTYLTLKSEQNNSASALNSGVKILMDGTAIRTVDDISVADLNNTGSTRVRKVAATVGWAHIPSAGSHTYTIQVKMTESATRSSYLESAVLKISEAKR